MPTEQELSDIFLGPPASTDQSWLLPTYQQPGYGGQYIEGGFPATTFANTWSPEPQSTSWLSSLSKPFTDFGGSLLKTAEPVIQRSYEKLPEMLWGIALERSGVIDRPKAVPIDEGAGVEVIHTQPAHAGGEPAKPWQPVVPMYASAGLSKPGDMPVSWIIIALIAAVVLFKGK